ncbi:MAG: hypothetical protein ACR2NX_13335 [Chthoniobacterales bacterium]
MVRPAVFERSCDDVIGANTEQAREIEEYLIALRRPADQSLETFGLDFSSAEITRARKRSCGLCSARAEFS